MIVNTPSAVRVSPISLFGPRAGEFCSLRRGRADHSIPRTSVSKQVKVVVVSGHTITCPSSDSGDEDSTIPFVVGKTAGLWCGNVAKTAHLTYRDKEDQLIEVSSKAEGKKQRINTLQFVLLSRCLLT